MTTQLTLWDKLLPDQATNNYYFEGDSYHRTLYNLITRTGDIRPPNETFTLTLSDRVSVEEMASNPIQLRLLEILVRLTGARHILEIGAFIGLSAMAMARAMPPGGKLVTIEKFDHFAEICRKNFTANKLTDRITLMEGDAADVFAKLRSEQPFDLVFIDGNKERYGHYFELAAPRVRSGGMILVDDILFHGDALNAQPRTEKGRGVKEFLELATARNDFLRLALPFSNGLMLMIKN